MYRHFLGLVIVAILLMAAGSALAETRIWDGGAGNNYWQTASNLGSRRKRIRQARVTLLRFTTFVGSGSKDYRQYRRRASLTIAPGNWAHVARMSSTTLMT